jgi:radical SAM superfamily enzyme YgiQ (UPF0313 family)
MRVGIIVGYMDQHRKGRHNRGAVQPQIGPLIAALLPGDVEIEIVNTTWEDPDWSRSYDLLFLSALHPDFDQIRRIAHYWRRRGAKTVLGGIMASTYPEICEPFFDAVVIGDPESTVPRVFDDFVRGRLQKVYSSGPYDAASVPTPRFDLVRGKQLAPLSLEATRGCPFSCEFCALTGIGTRFQLRPPELVIRDILAGQEMLRGKCPPYLRKWVWFSDNNLGGNIPWLRRFCEAIRPLNVQWSSAVTFNVAANPQLVKMLSEAGCRLLFVGLESFNPEALTDMHKVQNAVEKTRQVFDHCRDHGIVLTAGLLVNPLVDDRESMRAIPGQLRDCGLVLPAFISFEAPIPGTPHFHRLARSEGALLPDARLRDFTGYTLVTRPRRETVETFIEAYLRLLKTVYSRTNRLRMLAHNLPRLFRHRSWRMMAGLTAYAMTMSWDPSPERTFLAGTDLEPPELRRIPLSGSDFTSAAERRAVMEPYPVTGRHGEVLPQWLHSRRGFAPAASAAEHHAALTAV